VPRDNHDRTVVVRLTPEAVVVDYRLEVDETRAAQDLPRSQYAGVASRKDFYAVFSRYFAPVLGENLVARLDGKALEFVCVRRRHELLDHLRCDYRFRAPWKLTPGRRHAFDFREGNYALDTASVLSVSLSASSGLTLGRVDAPDEALVSRPPEERSGRDAERLREVKATFVAEPSVERGVAKPALPPDPEAPRPPPRKRCRAQLAAVKPGPAAEDVVAVARRTGPPAEAEEGVAGGEEGPRQLLHLLLDTRHGLAVALLLAAAFGAAHALTPGHGKTSSPPTWWASTARCGTPSCWGWSRR
jgi:hypothetical protein